MRRRSPYGVVLYAPAFSLRPWFLVLAPCLFAPLIHAGGCAHTLVPFLLFTLRDTHLLQLLLLRTAAATAATTEYCCHPTHSPTHHSNSR